MILSEQELLCDDQDFGTGSSTALADSTELSTNTIDLLSIRNIGKGVPVPVLVQITEAFAGGTSVNFQLIDDDNAALTSPAVLQSSGVIATAALTLGARIALDYVPTAQSQRYFGLQLVGVGTFTTGMITAGLVLGHQTNLGAV